MASRGVNKVILLGNLGSDPDLREMPNGNAVVNVSLATSISWKDKDTGEKKEKTEWHRLVFYANLADVVAKYTRKGSQIFVEGRLQTRKFQNKHGYDQYTTEIIAEEMQLLRDQLKTDQQTTVNKPDQQTTGNKPYDDDIPF